MSVDTLHPYLHCALHFDTTDAMQDLIGTTEAVKILGVHPSTVTRWVKAGKLVPAGRLTDAGNGALVFNRADIEALAAAS